MKRQPPLPRTFNRFHRWLLWHLGADGRDTVNHNDALKSMLDKGIAIGRKQSTVVYQGGYCPYCGQLLIETEYRRFDCPACRYPLLAPQNTDPLAEVRPTPTDALHSGDTDVLLAIKAGEYPAGTLARAYHARHVGALGDDTRKVRRVLLKGKP